MNPNIVVFTSTEIDESSIPKSVELCITFRHAHKLTHFNQLDIYMVDEIGFLGHSNNQKTWTTYNDQYFYELSDTNNLVITSLYNLTQPILRIQVDDKVTAFNDSNIEFGDLSKYG